MPPGGHLFAAGRAEKARCGLSIYACPGDRVGPIQLRFATAMWNPTDPTTVYFRGLRLTLFDTADMSPPQFPEDDNSAPAMLPRGPC
ncbi:hypothetical protein M728_000016 [Ensifer sp. WSM1721]